MTSWTAMPLLLILLVCCALQEPSAAKECRDGFYKTPEGVCCRLCPAGTFKVADCIVDGRKAFCDLCPKDTFNNRDNQEGKCSWCSSCGSGQQVVVNCCVAQDTVCRCEEGLTRDGDSEICLPEESHPDATVLLVIIIGYVLAALMFNVFSFKKKLKWSNLKKILKRSGKVLRAIRDKESHLKLWIARDPNHLLLQLMSRGRIPKELFTEAKSIRDGAECAELLLKYFVDGGNDDCLKLLFSLQAVQDRYPGVKEWLGGLGFLRRLSTCPVDLNSYSEDFLRDKIRFQTSKLLLVRDNDLKPLVSQLHIRNILTDNSVLALKAMQARLGSEKAMQHILELVMARGRCRVKQFWEVLWDLRKSYPNLEDIFEKF